MSDILHIIMTGGTIDSSWSSRQDATVVNDHSVIPEYIKSLSLVQPVEYTEVCMKDSRALADDDRQKLLEVVEASKARKLIVTHGTFTMPDTARFLQKNLSRHDQTIILTGSLTPLKGFELSDAGFNLGYAAAKAQELDAGIYLSMKAKTLSIEEAEKSLSEGKFYSIFEDKQ